MAGFDTSVLRDCIEGLAECRSQSDNDSQQSADQLLALVDHSFSVLHEYVEECVDEDPVLTHSVYLLLVQLVTLWYESGALNETTLKTWRLFPKVLERHAGELDDRNALEFCRLLISYCSEGLDTLQVDTICLGEGIELYLEQHNSTIKLIGFFTLRLLELLRYCCEQLRDHLPTALSLVLRYLSVLHLIGQHSNSVSSQAGKTLLYLRRALQGHSVKGTVAATLLCTTKSDISSSDAVYQTHVGVICCAIEYVEQYSVQISQSSDRLRAEDDVMIGTADVANWVDVFTNTMQSVCIESTGLVDDGYLLALLQRMVVALANAMSLATTELDLCNLIKACIRTERSKSSIARMLLTGVLRSFENEAQVSLVQAVWQVCRAALLHSTCTAEVVAVSLALRSVLLVVESARARYELLCNILRFADIFATVTGCSSPQHMPQQDIGSAAVPQSVKERLLAELPVTHLLSQDEGDSSQRLLSSLLAQSVASIETYAGAPGAAGTSAGDGGGIEIGRALSILRASSGYRESAGVVGKAGQSEGWRQAREPIVRNISLGTVVLRWISSLSQHIKILLPLPDSASATGTSSNSSSSDILNVHRLSRVDRLVDTLTAMVQCLWGHAVPRAVQTILAKAAQCCAETALSVLSYRVRADSEDMLVVTAVDKLLRGVANTLTVIANPSFSEKSVDAVKGVYAVWHRASSLCVQHPRATVSAYGWQELVRMLASLQRFANSLPVPLKPRARELVDPALVSVIQARALGRTFSLIRRCDVTDEAIANRNVPQALQIGVHELSVRGLHEETVTAASRPHLVQQIGSKSYDRDGTNTSAERPENTYYSDENKTCDINEAGYEEIDATAGTEGEEEEEMGREEKRDREENESDNAHEQEGSGHLAKRQRSGTQGSNDDDDGGFADEFIY